MDASRTCCFTGHRPDKLPWGPDESDPRCAALKTVIQLSEAIIARCKKNATPILWKAVE